MTPSAAPTNNSQMNTDQRRQKTPLPRKQMIILSTVVFAEPVSLTILYPFVYFMVRDFHLSDDERDIGYFAGLVAASFSLAQFLTSVPWGIVSNHWGRRPVILIGLLGNVVTSILFGFSRSLQWAIITRACCGLLNGNIAVAKCVLGEITDSSNQGEAFSMFGFMFGLGSLIAPTLGGLLADPVGKYPQLFGHITLLREYPYLLPCVVSSLFSLFGLVMGILYLEETLGKRPANKRFATCVVEDEMRSITPENLKHYDSLSSKDDLIRRSSPSPSSYSTSTFVDSYPIADETHIDNCNTATLSVNTTTTTTNTLSLCRRSIPVIIAYTLLALLAIIFQEVYVFWCNASPANGGLGWSSTEVGLSMAAGGGILLFIQLIIFPRLQMRFGNLSLFRNSMLANAPVCFALPLIHRSLAVGPVAIWSWTLLHHFVRCLCQACCFTTVMIMVNNSATHETLGIVNGIGQASASLVRGIGPALGGWLWQVSLKSGFGFPFDYHFVFVMLAVLSVLSWLQSFTIPSSVDRMSLSGGGGDEDESAFLIAAEH